MASPSLRRFNAMTRLVSVWPGLRLFVEFTVMMAGWAAEQKSARAAVEKRSFIFVRQFADGGCSCLLCALFYFKRVCDRNGNRGRSSREIVSALSMNSALGHASRLSGSAGFQPAPAGKMPALLYRQDACATARSLRSARK